MKTQTDYTALLQAAEFHAGAPPPPENIVFRIQYEVIGSLGDYVTFTGRPKAGKGKFIAGAMAAALSRTEVFGMNIRLPAERCRIAHFDTEQGPGAHYRHLKLALDLSGLDHFPANFKSYRLRQYSAAHIRKMINQYLVSYPDTGILFLDGLLDLIGSFNDEGDSKDLVNWLKNITELNNLLLIGVLHRSVSANKSIGHLGSSADRAAQSVLTVEKNKETSQYVLRPEYLRDGAEFSPVAITYSKQLSTWIDAEYIDESAANLKPTDHAPRERRKTPAEISMPDHAARIPLIFSENTELSNKELIESIKIAYGVSRPWAVDCRSELIKHNLIFRRGDNFTHIKQTKLFKIDPVTD